jgi:prephenate dehydratase
MTNPLRIAVQGAPGCFSHAAGLTLFPALELVPCDSFPELFDAVESGRAHAALVPVENALAGAVAENLDLLSRSELRALAETLVPVEMCLAVRPEAAEAGVAGVRAAASHPVALQQCRRFFREHGHIRSIVTSDTAGSVREIMQGDPGWDAGIGPALAAELYGARVIARGIQDDAANYTRFLVMARRDEALLASGSTGLGQALEVGRNASVLAAHGLELSGREKVSLVVTAPHEPGSLHRVIGVFAAQGLDLTRIESRPIPGSPWEYLFHMDVRGGDPGALDAALVELRDTAAHVLELGRYPEVGLAPAPAGDTP